MYVRALRKCQTLCYLGRIRRWVTQKIFFAPRLDSLASYLMDKLSLNCFEQIFWEMRLFTDVLFSDLGLFLVILVLHKHCAPFSLLKGILNFCLLIHILAFQLLHRASLSFSFFFALNIIFVYSSHCFSVKLHLFLFCIVKFYHYNLIPFPMHASFPYFIQYAFYMLIWKQFVLGWYMESWTSL